MKRLGPWFIFVIILSACGPAPTAAHTPDTQATIAVVSGTMLAGTLTAQPSATPSFTSSPQPTPTVQPTETTTLEPTISPTPSRTATPWSGHFSPGDTEGLPTGLLRIENNSGVSEIIVTLNGITLTREQPVYYSYKVTGSLNLNIYWARYQYIVQIPGKRVLTGTFGQASKDKTTMRVNLTQVVIVGP